MRSDTVVDEQETAIAGMTGRLPGASSPGAPGRSRPGREGREEA